jgi:hypothetical protein
VISKASKSRPDRTGGFRRDDLVDDRDHESLEEVIAGFEFDDAVLFDQRADNRIVSERVVGVGHVESVDPRPDSGCVRT